MQLGKPKIKDVIIRDLMNKSHESLKVLPKQLLDDLWPDALLPEHCELTIDGAPAVSGNLLRVILVGELIAKGLCIDMSVIGFVETNDSEVFPFHIA